MNEDQEPIGWNCGCGWINGLNLDHCAQCGRPPHDDPNSGPNTCTIVYQAVNPILYKQATGLLLIAAHELLMTARQLKQSSTINGEWDPEEIDAKDEYDRLMGLVQLFKGFQNI